MDALIEAAFTQSPTIYIDLSARKYAFKEDLDRIFGPDGDVELWKYRREANLEELKIASIDEFGAANGVSPPQRMCID
jgi:hypothetical protein